MEIQGLLWVHVFPLSFSFLRNFDSLYLWLCLKNQKASIIKTQAI